MVHPVWRVEGWFQVVHPDRRVEGWFMVVHPNSRVGGWFHVVHPDGDRLVHVEGDWLTVADASPPQRPVVRGRGATAIADAGGEAAAKPLCALLRFEVPGAVLRVAR